MSEYDVWYVRLDGTRGVVRVRAENAERACILAAVKRTDFDEIVEVREA